MNVILEERLQHSLLSDKDKYEIRLIFGVLTDEKKMNFINNFYKVEADLIRLHEELLEKQKILLGKAISNIENAIKKAQFNGLGNATKQSIGALKEEI